MKNVILTMHDPKIHEGWNFLFTTVSKMSHFLITKVGKFFIVHGKQLKKEFSQNYSIKPQNIFIAPLGWYNSNLLKKYSEKNVSIKKGNILFFGRIQKYKGLDFLLESFNDISKTHSYVSLTICGEPLISNFLPYKKYIHKGQNIKYIPLKNYYDYKKISFYFLRSEMVVLPYISATASGVIPNAMVFKKPVIATSVGAIPETIISGENGILVPPKDKDALSKAIISLLDDETFSRKLGINGFNYLQEFQSTEKLGEIHKTIYLKLKGINK